jgi:hypothetical protein
MKRSQILVAVAVAGLLGMSARASLPDGYSSVKIKLTALMQAPTTTTTSSAKYNITKVKITNKEMLNLIATEYDVSLGDGSQLVLNNIWSGYFSVLNKDGAVLIGNASYTPFESNWELRMFIDNYVYTGKSSSSSTKYSYDAITDLSWTDGDDFNYFDVYGETTIDDSYKSSGSKESFKLNGADNGQWMGDSAVVSGTVSGSGKNNLGG